MLGLMLSTMFLSMWISNTATTAMMLPVVDAIIAELENSMKLSKQKGNCFTKKKRNLIMID